MRKFTIIEAGELMRISRASVYRELSSGRLKAVKVGKRTLITEEAITAWNAALPAASFKAVAGRGSAGVR